MPHGAATSRSHCAWTARVVVFMPALTQALEVPPEAGNDAAMRTQAFSHSGSVSAAAFNGAWEHIQAAGGARSEDTLAQVFTRTASQGKGMQHAVTAWVEKAQFQTLDVDIRALPQSDLRKAAWLNTDRFSTVGVIAWPSAECRFSNPEF